ncbi:class I SAM-dependent methyltransferase [Jiangella anatolica]|nr:methyltransferase domain-containing protein [Jiangella anatolica]
MFTSGFARHVARRYRKRGLDRTATRMVAFLRERGIEGATVLEIGGGVGEIQVELLRLGAASAVGLELSPSYRDEAARLLAEAGLTGRAQYRLHDIAADPAGAPAADVVVLHRVVCCYPDYERLLAAVADHANRLVVFSHPPRNLGGRVFVGVTNLVMRLRRERYRAFVHPPEAMLGVLRERGLRPAYTHRGFTWQIAGLERGGPA